MGLVARLNVLGLAAAGLLIIAGSAPAATLNYSFESDNQGWTSTPAPPAASTDHPTALSRYANTGEPNSPTASNGTVQIAPFVDSFNCCHQDDPHVTLRFSSPGFTLGASGSITFDLDGGAGAAASPEADLSGLPANSVGDGFQGMALRNATTGTYLLSARKSGDGNTYEANGFSNAALSGAGVLNNSTPLIVELIDYRNGGWGWIAMDNVALNDATLVPEPTSILSLAGLTMVATFRRRRGA